MNVLPVDILMVEDSGDDLELARIALDRSTPGLRVHEARDGVEALVALGCIEGSGDRVVPRLVLLDLKLPKVDGLEVLARLRAHPPTARIPVVMLTSSRLQSDVDRCYAAGANSYIVKPSSFERFTGAMRQIAAYWLELNQPANSQ